MRNLLLYTAVNDILQVAIAAELNCLREEPVPFLNAMLRVLPIGKQ